MIAAASRTSPLEYKVNGAYNAAFDTSAVASGFYFYTLEVNDFTSTKKMMLIK